tara:strand:+ start:107188 stop:107406 length:219 start_codon:yes stop_codon:yes gene_type:complete
LLDGSMKNSAALYGEFGASFLFLRTGTPKLLYGIATAKSKEIFAISAIKCIANLAIQIERLQFSSIFTFTLT